MVDNSKPDLILYHAAHTRSIRVRWLMEELGLPYKIEVVKSDTRPFGDEAYARINPLRKVPALVHGDQIICESLAIMEYIMNRYGSGDLALDPDDPEYGRYLQYLHFGEAGMIMPVSMLVGHTALLPKERRNADMAAWAGYETDKLLSVLSEDALGDRDYVAGGKFTAADISIMYMLYLLKIVRQFENPPDNLKAYFDRLAARPGWAAAMAD